MKEKLYRETDYTNVFILGMIQIKKSRDSDHDHGPYKGHSLQKVFEEHRKLFANSKGPRFPLLVKINELDGSPSVQAHLDDVYAKEYCDDLGEAEFCLYIEVVPGAKIVRGHTAKTKVELLQMEMGFRKPIKKNDFVYTPPGIVHGS